MPERFQAPDVPNSQVTPLFVRDQLLKCFESANREFMEALHQPVGEEQIRQQVKSFVEGVFTQCGVSYVEPTKLGIVTAIDQCKRNAEGMMGTQGAPIIAHHYEEMMKLVRRLPE